MRLIKILFSSICLGIFITPLQAQEEKTAEEIYSNLGYKSSIPHLENKKVIAVKDMARIANAYRLNHDTENAEFWYSQFVDESTDPQHYLHYAEALQSNGRFDLAKEYYLKYDASVGGAEGADQRGRLLATAIDQMDELKHTEIQIKNESLINTEKLDFSPAYYKEGVVFVSTRSSQSENSDAVKDIWIDDNFMGLFYARKNESGALSNAELLSADLTSKYHEGPVCFSKNGEKIYFTRNDFVKDKRRNSKDGTMKLQIYSSFNNGDGWSEPLELPFNTVDYEEAHPALSNDGKKLYFSSNRPGGLGGMDLYVSNFENGSWAEPVNLGDQVNTAGNEVFPVIHDDGTFYFSSNGWGGIGGLDVFSMNELENGAWTKIENVGTPFNSKKDDFGLVFNLLKTEGYFTSARRNGNGQDDIYSFKMPNKLPVKMQLCAYEAKSKTPLADVQFEVVEKFNESSSATASLNDEDMLMTLEKVQNKNDEYVLKFKQRGYDISDDDAVKLFNTNNDGTVETYFKENRTYLIIATKDGYKLAEETFDGAALKGKDFFEFCVPLEKMNCMNLDGVVKHEKYGNVIPGATVTMTNLCTGDDVVVTADENGYFTFPCINCGCDFVLKGQKTNFNDGGDRTNTIGDNCVLGSTVSTEILLNNDKEKIEAIFAGTKLEEGAIIELENIYYDFDKYYIRDDAKDELDHIVKLLQIYPSMVVELSSHTDARATDRYNEKLSQNRANAAVEYIISRGIDRSRLVPMGYGERSLKNNCANFVDCTEEEHQRNRRTEIRVLRFDEKDIKVKHIDNMPETIDPANPKRKFIWD